MERERQGRENRKNGRRLKGRRERKQEGVKEMKGDG